MKTAWLLPLFLQIFNFALVTAGGVDGKVFGRADLADANDCDVRHALHILESLSSSGDAFCTSLLHTRKGARVTQTITTTTAEECSVRTETTTEHGTFTTTVYGKTTTLPTITITSYSSSVLIPSGPSRKINKRDSPATPTSLTTCPAGTLSTACSSLLAPSTIVTTLTSTHTEHKCISTTTATFTTTRHTTTVKIPFVVTPPPFTATGVGVLTTTVPADCVSSPYVPQANNVPDGDIVTFPSYPDYPRTLVQCCVVCHRTLNCIAAAYISDIEECEFLLQNGTASSTGKSNICPLGVQDYDFGSPMQDGDILPGPCGK